MPPGQKFGCRHCFLLAPLPAQGRAQGSEFAPAGYSCHLGHRTIAAADHRIAAFLNFRKQCGYVSLGLADLHSSCHGSTSLNQPAFKPRFWLPSGQSGQDSFGKTWSSACPGRAIAIERCRLPHFCISVMLCENRHTPKGHKVRISCSRCFTGQLDHSHDQCQPRPASSSTPSPTEETQPNRPFNVQPPFGADRAVLHRMQSTSDAQ